MSVRVANQAVALVRPRRSRELELFLSRRAAVGALILLGLIAGAAIAAPLVAPHDPYVQDLAGRLAPPVWAGGTLNNPLGTDQLGRDILSRLIWGGRVSLAISVTAVALSGLIGVSAGVASGYYGRLVDEVIMRLAEVRLALPLILLVISAVVVFGPSLWNLIVILALTGWVPYARIVRAEVLSVREREFVTAARAIGSGDFRIMFRHILPNTVASAIVIGSLELANVIVLESSLGFLGLGVQPPTPSWGNMLGEGRDYLMTTWWLTTFPGLTISMTAVSINLVGDALRDALDPRLRH